MIDQSDDEYPPEAYIAPRLMDLLELFRDMPAPVRERFLRESQRVAALPPEVQASLTRGMMMYMLENDVDLPRH
ncbi:hypothetical protein ABIB42_005194 [Massilia sp. UYP32]|jgi:hypothetical protein|uniref:Uncharacterized protein n=1 Tax=Massilia timonae CCUG 45783 TaxID=883126 RepID=K9DFV3_9BURK|nr:hypothetical protein [Massilia timonae]EKU82171.1 hypothetical protein HMPREF9710_02482 [Massilia timonae CCUG 45783]